MDLGLGVGEVDRRLSVVVVVGLLSQPASLRQMPRRPADEAPSRRVQLDEGEGGDDEGEGGGGVSGGVEDDGDESGGVGGDVGGEKKREVGEVE